MNSEKFNRIIATIRNHRGLSKDCLAVLKSNFHDVPHNTLSSILSLEYQNRMKISYVKTPELLEKFYNQYMQAVKEGEEPGIIIRMAKECGITPCLIGKLVLQKFFEIRNEVTEKDNIEDQQNINIYMRNTSLIPDMDLAFEIYLCTIYDDQYSPLVETIKNCLGQQYEIYLERILTELGLAFRNEDYLRRYGYDKTPDIKLEVPIVIDGVIINWVESKALFGTEDVHKEYTRNQYLSYWNRFGSGLVIYWFGFVDTLLVMNDKKFIVRDNFPKDFVHMSSAE